MMVDLMCSYLFLTSQFFISCAEPSYYQGLILLVRTCDNLQKPQEISHCTQTTSDKELDSSKVLLKTRVPSASNQGQEPGGRTTALKLSCHTRMRILYSAGLIQNRSAHRGCLLRIRKEIWVDYFIYKAHVSFSYLFCQHNKIIQMILTSA